MAVTFKAEDHKYESLDPNDRITWLSVTTFVGQFKQKFDMINVNQIYLALIQFRDKV